MSKEFKKAFFTSLLAVLLVVSNLIGLKLTNFLDLTISVNFLTYPFTFLCTLIIFNLSGKKSAFQSVLIAALIQIFITISYTLAISLGNQSVMPDMSLYVNELFKVKELNILASLVAFLASHYVLIYIYDNFKKYGKELFGIVIGLLAALFLDATIYTIVTLSSYDLMFIINMLLSNIIVSIMMLICITILFYLLKEKEQEAVTIESMNIKVTPEKDNDKAIEELISDNNLKITKKTNQTVKSKTKNRNKVYQNTKKATTKTNKNTKSSKTKSLDQKNNQSKKSQTTVNKINKK